MLNEYVEVLKYDETNVEGWKFGWDHFRGGWERWKEKLVGCWMVNLEGESIQFGNEEVKELVKQESKIKVWFVVAGSIFIKEVECWRRGENAYYVDGNKLF